MRLSSFMALGVFSALLAACTTYGTAQNVKQVEDKIAKKGQYWQRTDATDAIWTQGVKAQQLLNRDLSRCVTELAELERLGQIKGAFPAEKKDTDTTTDSAHQSLMGWDAPERDGALRAEVLPYTDFESCMTDKGWERVMSVPYDAARRDAQTYIDNHVYLRSRSTYEPAKIGKVGKGGPYDNLNN